MAAEDMGFTVPKAPRRAAVGLPGGRHRRGRVGHARRDPAGRGGHRPRGAGEERRRRRHVAGERLPRRGRRHPEPPLLVLVRAAALVHPLRQARRGAHLPARRGRRPRPARGHPVRHRGGERGLPRPALDRHHRRGRDAHRGRRDHRRRTAQPAEDPTAAGPGHVPRARCSTRRAGPRTSTSPASGWWSSAPGRARCRSCPRSPSGPGTSPCSSARRSGPRPTTCTSPPSTTPRRCSWSTCRSTGAGTARGCRGTRATGCTPRCRRTREWEHGDRSVNAVNDGHRRVFTRYVESELAGRADLVAKALPDYPPFGKRMLLDNGWYAALRRDDVDLVTAPVAAVTPTGVRAAGRHRDRGRRRGAVHGVRGPEAAVAVVDHAAGTG